MNGCADSSSNSKAIKHLAQAHSAHIGSLYPARDNTRSRCCAVVTVLHVAVIFFVIVAGLTQADPANLQPFAPFGLRGIFDGNVP